MGGRGVLFLVVGPSGVGKDTLMDAARAAMSDDPRFQFAQRWITRPADAGGEDHYPVSEDGFRAHEAQGGFILSWRAHGLHYGVPAAYGDALAGGAHVVANVSRGVIDEARKLLHPVWVLSITASPAALCARLSARGRESAAEIDARIARAAAYRVEGPDVVTIANDGSVEHGVSLFLAALRQGA